MLFYFSERVSFNPVTLTPLSATVVRNILNMKNLCAFLSFIIFSASSCTSNERTLDETLRTSAEWMWQQQSPDGGWHSQTHAVLRDGKVLTPFILYHLVQVPVEIYKPKDEDIHKAVDFIIEGLQSSLDESELTLTDYPNYSAAYALRVLHKCNRDTSLRHIIADYLMAQQFCEQRGFEPGHLAYGGWGYGESNLAHGEHGHVDLSHTRRITEALVETGFIKIPQKEAKETIYDAVLLFLNGVQRVPDDARLYEGCTSRKNLPYDGGFISSVVTLATNKSLPVEIPEAGIHYPSYATATCDGLMTLYALGQKNIPRFDDAKNWLLHHQHMNTIDGLSPDDPEQWDEVMHFYHLAVRAEAMNLIEPNGAWADKIRAILKKEQYPDGHYVNPIGGVNKEDDPLMATILCIISALNTIQ